MSLTTQVPEAGTPIFNERGYIDPVWHNFFNTLMRRTGGTLGVDADSDSASMNATAFGDSSASRPGDELLQAQLVQSRDSVDGMHQAPNHGQHNDPILHDVATPTANGFMAATDKSKLDSVVIPIALPVSLTADVVTQNTTADGPVLAFTLPISTITVGTTIAVRLLGLITAAASAGTLSVWIKSGVTKVMTQTFTLPGLGQVNTGLFYTASITARTVGASGTMQIASLMTSNGNALNGGPAVGSVSAALNTTIANTFTVGWSWSAANAGNVATAKNATFLLEKQ